MEVPIAYLRTTKDGSLETLLTTPGTATLPDALAKVTGSYGVFGENKSTLSGDYTSAVLKVMQNPHGYAIEPAARQERIGSIVYKGQDPVDAPRFLGLGVDNKRFIVRLGADGAAVTLCLNDSVLEENDAPGGASELLWSESGKTLWPLLAAGRHPFSKHEGVGHQRRRTHPFPSGFSDRLIEVYSPADAGRAVALAPGLSLYFRGPDFFETQQL